MTLGLKVGALDTESLNIKVEILVSVALKLSIETHLNDPRTGSVGPGY